MSSPLLLWNHLETLIQRCIVHECCVLFLDYDGTLAPIVEDPAAAQMAPAMQHALTALAQHPRYRVGIVSGRALADLRTRVEGKGLYLAGNHGLEIEGPGISYQHPEAWWLRPELDALAQAMNSDLEAIPGAWVEDKGLTLSMHFRRVSAASVPEVKARLIKHVAPGIDAGLLALRTGKAVLEIRPRVEWSKGEAVSWILEQIRLESRRPVCWRSTSAMMTLMRMPFASSLPLALVSLWAATARIRGPVLRRIDRGGRTIAHGAEYLILASDLAG